MRKMIKINGSNIAAHSQSTKRVAVQMVLTTIINKKQTPEAMSFWSLLFVIHLLLINVSHLK